MDTTNTITLRREPGPVTRSLVALLLRLSLGLMMLMYGLGKLDAERKGSYPDAIVKQFEPVRLPILDRPLPGVHLFATVLPYAEITVGGLLIAGLLTPISAGLSGLLLLHLLFGNLVLNDAAKSSGMIGYILLNAGVLWLSPVTSNYLSLDGLFFGWFWRPRDEGEFRREPDLMGSR